MPGAITGDADDWRVLHCFPKETAPSDPAPGAAASSAWSLNEDSRPRRRTEWSSAGVKTLPPWRAVRSDRQRLEVA